jgi:subtilase family serine protease
MTRRFLALAAACAVTACNGGAGSSLPSAGGSNFPVLQNTGVAGGGSVLRPYRGPAGLADFTWGRAARERMQFLRSATAGVMHVDVLVRMRDATGLLRYAEAASNPHAAEYRHFLTPYEVGERYGASEGDYETVAEYFWKFGMGVGKWPQREVLSVTGTLKQMQRAFGTNFGYYYYGKQLVLAPLETPHFSKRLPVASVMHLTTYDPTHRYYERGNYAHFAGYSPQMLANGFDYSGAYAAGYTGKGITPGINGTWAISPADVPAYGALWHAHVAKVTQVVASPQPPSKRNGHTGTKKVDPYPAGLSSPPPITAPCRIPPFPKPPDYNVCNPEDVEAQLDTEQVASLAPDANVLFYIAYNPSICVNPQTGEIVSNKKDGSCPQGAERYPLMGIQLADDSLQQSIADNRADSLSLSWGEPENDALATDYISKNPDKPGVGQIEFASLAAEGIAVFVSTGDNGAWECFDPNTGQPLGIACLSYPASDPNVTGVGGVNIPLDDGGRLDGQITAWGDNTTGGGNGEFENNVGSGGGVSTVFPAPPWQVAALKNKMRKIPDMSLDADPNTGPSQVIYSAFKGKREVFADGGTSVSAPESNAEWALVLDACSRSSACATAKGAKPYRLGNAAPLYYEIFRGEAALDYKHTFYDVIYGCNQAVPAPTAAPSPGHTPAPLPTPTGYCSGRGYDMVTGLGAPFGGHLIDALVKGANAK